MLDVLVGTPEINDVVNSSVGHLGWALCSHVDLTSAPLQPFCFPILNVTVSVESFFLFHVLYVLC